jgi:hypothetical protein
LPKSTFHIKYTVNNKQKIISTENACFYLFKNQIAPVYYDIKKCGEYFIIEKIVIENEEEFIV